MMKHVVQEMRNLNSCILHISSFCPCIVYGLVVQSAVQSSIRRWLKVGILIEPPKTIQLVNYFSVSYSILLVINYVISRCWPCWRQSASFRHPLQDHEPKRIVQRECHQFISGHLVVLSDSRSSWPSSLFRWSSAPWGDLRVVYLHDRCLVYHRCGQHLAAHSYLRRPVQNVPQSNLLLHHRPGFCWRRNWTCTRAHLCLLLPTFLFGASCRDN